MCAISTAINSSNFPIPWKALPQIMFHVVAAIMVIIIYNIASKNLNKIVSDRFVWIVFMWEKKKEFSVPPQWYSQQYEESLGEKKNYWKKVKRECERIFKLDLDHIRKFLYSDFVLLSYLIHVIIVSTFHPVTSTSIFRISLNRKTRHSI